ncbi:MAG TPA: GNAT family N-acetyltransferase [Kribbella sp.]|nr:GNAT family N-acetyltransferase [Kribbella sp.]
MDHTFVGEIIEWRGPAPYYFVAVPDEDRATVRAAVAACGYGWGTVAVRASMGSTEWKTSLWSREGGYLLPLKDAVRKPAGLDAGDTVEVRLSFEPQPRKQKAPPRERAPRPVGPREPVTAEQLTILPATQASWDDLQAIVGAGGDPARCWCQRFRMLPKESWASEGPEELAARLRDQTACGTPASHPTTGLIAYLRPHASGPGAGFGEPVGWCAVAPRADHPRLLRDYRVPWLGRTEDKADPSVWAVTCFVTRIGYRRRGISRFLAQAAVSFAREHGARAIEGYPDLVDGGSVGTLATFTEAGFTEVAHPGNRRAVLRIDFAADSERLSN